MSNLERRVVRLESMVTKLLLAKYGDLDTLLTTGESDEKNFAFTTAKHLVEAETDHVHELTTPIRCHPS